MTRLLKLSVAVILASCAGTVVQVPVNQPVEPAARPSPPPVDPARIVSRADVRREIDSLVNQPEFRSANWGILVVNPETGDTLYSHNAGKLFIPASNTKLVTGAVALLKLGPNFRWLTTIAAHGHLESGRLAGDLVVYGRGDPTVNSRMRGDAMSPLRDIADSLLARGINHVTGDVLQGGHAFSDPRWGAGWQWDYLDASYAAAVDALFFNEGTVRVRVRGATLPGMPPEVETEPARSFPIVRVEAITQQPLNGNRPRIQVSLDSVSSEVVVSGTIAPGDSTVETVTLRDPATAYLFALREALASRGIAIDGEAAAQPAFDNGDIADTLLVVESPPFSEVLREMMKPSQNQMAEIFLKTLGLEVTGVGTADSGLRVIGDQLREWGVPDDGYALRDGSGLTRNNFISPETIARVLHQMRTHELFPVYFDALPIAAVDGTLGSRMRNTPAAGNVRGKTGTLARASALSGYVRTLDGTELIFSLLCNNFTTPSSAVTGMQNQIAVLLASLDWSR